MSDPHQQSERMREAVDRKDEEAKARSEQESRVAPDRPPDVPGPRAKAKSTGHKKQTADRSRPSRPARLSARRVP